MCETTSTVVWLWVGKRGQNKMTEQFHSRLYLVQMSLYSNIDSISMMTFCALNFYAQPSVEVQHLVFLMEKKLIK